MFCFSSGMCIKLAALRINWYLRSSQQFQKDWRPMDYMNTECHLTPSFTVQAHKAVADTDWCLSESNRKPGRLIQVKQSEEQREVNKFLRSALFLK